MKLDLTGVKGVIAAILIVLSLLIGVLNAVQGALPPTVESLGVTNFDDITLSGDLNANDVIATGYITGNSVYPAVSSAGYITADTSLLASGTLDVVGATTFGGGFGSTGCSISAAGVLQCNGAAEIGGAATITGAATLVDALTIGGGFGSTGCTVSAAGVLQCNGAMTIGGAATITGALTVHNTTEINGNLDVDSFSTAGNMDITTVNNTGVDPVTVNDDLVVTGTLSVNGETFSGPIKYGTEATYTSGAAITHGFATTPTMCIIQPARDVTSTVTIGETTFSSDMETVATPIYWMCGQ